MFADYHVHTQFSDDSVYPMEQVIKDAAAMGMEEICFTDYDKGRLGVRHTDAYHSTI